MKFSDFLREQKEKHAVLAFGRMNPITSGHEKLVNKVKDIAKSVGGSHHIVLSHSQDPRKNPLTAAQKVKHAKRAFPDANFTAASKDAPTFFDHAEKLHKQGVTHLHMVGGSDRTAEYHRLLKKYNGTHEGARFNFKSIKVHSAGERDPDAEGTTGISASKMREHAGKGSYKKFKQGAPSSMSDEHVKHMYNDVRRGMNLHESILAEGVHDKAIFKAVFLAGGPGSGKDYVLSNTLDGHGMIEINSDKALEYLMDKEALDKTMPDNEAGQRNVVRKKAKDITEIRHRMALQGRNGLIINGTGADPKEYEEIKKKLEKLGYDTSMIMVNTADEVSKSRNVERGQRGGRTVPENIRKQKWEEVQAARAQFGKIFRNNYIEFDNSEDLRQASPDVVKAKKEEMQQIHKEIQKFVSAPPKHENAKHWIASELGQKDTAPISKTAQPHPTAKTNDEMNTMGLEYYGFGRYGKGGKVTHRSLHDRLVPVEKITKTVETHKKKMEKSLGPKVKVRTEPNRHDRARAAKKKVNEAFEDFLQEAVTVTITGDTVEEVNKMFKMLKNEGDVKDEVEESNKTYGTSLSSSSAYNALTLGKQIVMEETQKKQKLMHDTNGKPRVFHFRMSAAKEAHRNNGVVHKVGKNYVVKIREDLNEISSPDNNAIEAVYGQNISTPDAKQLGKVGTNFRPKGKPALDKPVSESYGKSGSTSRPKITLNKIKENWSKKVEESIDKGIESGLSMASSGESPARDTGEKLSKKGKATQVIPIKELTGDETGASIGDQKEDELKKKGVSLTSFRKRNFV
jgi:predicted kinase